MLALTEDAAQAIDGIVNAAELPEGAGLRITTEEATQDDGQTRTDLRLALTEGPEEGDQVVEGSNVFIEEGTAELLDDKLLDAEVSEGEVQFSLLHQAG